MSKQILNPHSLLNQTIKRQLRLNKPQFQQLYRNYSSKFDKSTSTQIFAAPSARPIELVKKFSFATSVLGSVSVPLFYFCWDMPWVQESNLEYWSVVAAFLASVGSTSFLHWFCSPYVKKAYLDNSITETALNKGKTIEDCIMTPTTKITLETSTIMGQTKINTLELKQLKPGNLPHCTWKLQPELVKENPELSTKYWIDLPNKNYPGFNELIKIDNFIREWNRQK